MSDSSVFRKLINLLEAVSSGGYDAHIVTTVEWFDPDQDFVSDSKIFNVEADVNYGRSTNPSLSGNPESFDLGEDPEVANIVITDGDGNEVDPEELTGNGSREWRVYKIGDAALEAVYRKMEEDGYGPYDFSATPVPFHP